MENVKLPYLTEDTLRVQRVEIYLNDLKNRLKGLRQQHDEVIQNSVELIREIDHVSSSLLVQSGVSLDTQSDKVTKIQKLIQEFEQANQVSACAKRPITYESKVDIAKILQTFEKLTESQVLKNSLVLLNEFKERAKASFDTIDTLMEHGNRPQIGSNSFKSGSSNSKHVANLKQKISIFNGNGLHSPKNSLETIRKSQQQIGEGKVSKQRESSPSHFVSCCSSLSSVDVFHSTEEFAKLQLLTNGGVSQSNSLETGYEGDNDDSEYDLMANKASRKTKSLPPAL